MWTSPLGRLMNATHSLACRLLAVLGLDRQTWPFSIQAMARKAGSPTNRDGGGG